MKLTTQTGLRIDVADIAQVKVEMQSNALIVTANLVTGDKVIVYKFNLPDSKEGFISTNLKVQKFVGDLIRCGEYAALCRHAGRELAQTISNFNIDVRVWR